MRDKVVLIKKQRRKKIIRTARHALSHAILLSLTALGGTLLITAPGLGKIIQQANGTRNPDAAARAITRLYRRGLVTLSGTRGARKAMLTDSGKRLSHFLSIQMPKSPRVWDKTWFMVSFDIPAPQLKA